MYTKDGVFFPKERDFILFCIVLVMSIAISYFFFWILGRDWRAFVPSIILINFCVFLKNFLELKKASDFKQIKRGSFYNGLLSIAGFLGTIMCQTYLIITLPIDQCTFICMLLATILLWTFFLCFAILLSLDFNLKKIRKLEAEDFEKSDLD